MIAKDIMRRHVVTVAPQMTLRDAGFLFVNRKISGAPVVNEEGNVVGILSKTDIVRQDVGGVVDFFAREDDLLGPARPLDRTLVFEVMTKDVVSVDQQTPIGQLARLMFDRGIHRVLVTHDGRLKGIVTSMDLIKTIAVGPRLRRHNGITENQ